MNRAEIEKARNRERQRVIETAREDLSLFIEHCWKIVEPRTVYKHNWHIDAMSEHLMALFNNEIKNLLIMVPPGHMKSLLVAVFFPAWVFMKRPDSKFIFATYAEKLSIRDSIKCRTLIKSAEYRKDFAIDWDLASDQDTKTRYNTTVGGYRIATSVGGTGTGERADYTVFDDPIKASDAHSETIRDSVREWWDKEMSTRGADPQTSHKLGIMQRLHEDDLAGHCESTGDYEVLKLPAEYDNRKKITSIGWSDPRNTAGELLWPEQYPRTVIESLKKTLGPVDGPAQLQQDPKPAGGGLIKREYWKYYKELPMDLELIVNIWDCAAKPGISNDYSVCATWGRNSTGYYLLDIFREKLGAPDLENQAHIQYNKHKPNAILIEDKSNGIPLIQYLQRSTSFPIIPFDPGQKDKVVRAIAAVPTIAAGNCYLPFGAPWLEDFISEHEKFPNAKNDDIVDTTSMMVAYFNHGVFEPKVHFI